MSYRIVNPTPEMMADLARRFFQRRHLFAFDFGTNAPDLVEVFTAEDTVVYEVGSWGGVVYFTDIVPGNSGERWRTEPIARYHVLIWDRGCLGKSYEATELCLDFMGRLNVHRLLAEVPSWNTMALYAAKRTGFKMIGKLRHRYLRAGEWHNSYVLDALPADLIKARTEHRDGRHRRIRGQRGGEKLLSSAVA